MPPKQTTFPSPNAILHGPFGILLIVPSGADTGGLQRFQVFGPHGPAPSSFQLAANQIVQDIARDGSGLMAIRQLYGSQWGGLTGLSADMMVARLRRDLADGIMFAAFYIPSRDSTGFVVTKSVDISGLLADPLGTPVNWSRAQRIAAMLRRIPGCMPVALRDAANGLLTPKAIALFAALAVFMAVSQAFGAGEVIDGLLLAAAWRYAGWQGLMALKDFVTAIIRAAGETTLLAIQEDAQVAADALVVLGLTFLAAILHRAADQEKVMSTEPDPPREVPTPKKPSAARSKLEVSKNIPAKEPPPAQTYLYRGVHAKHPALAAAENGDVVPGNIDGTVTPEEHNLGGMADDSPYTSWTRNSAIAQFNANKEGPGGVILRLPTGAPPAGASWSWEWSPDEYREVEVLLRGVRSGAEVLPP